MKPALRIDPYLLWRWARNAVVAPQRQSAPDSSLADYVPVVVELRRSVPEKTRADRLVRLGFIPSHTNTMVDGPRRPCFRPGLVPKAMLAAFITESLDETGCIERFEVCLPHDAVNSSDGGLPRRRTETYLRGNLPALQVPLLKPGLPPERSRAEPEDVVPSQSAARIDEGKEEIPVSELSRWLHTPGTVARPLPSPVSPPRPRPTAPFVCVIDDRPGFAAAPELNVLVQGVDGPSIKAIQRSGYFEWALRFDRRFDRSSPGWIPINLAGAVSGFRLARSGGAIGQSPVHQPLNPNNEPETYRLAEYIRYTPHDSHGSGVLDLITGALRVGDRILEGPKPAPEVHFVQLPLATVLDTSGGSLGAFALDAIHDALHLSGPDRDVVVNFSFGTHSGGHDGTSLFECALVELLNLYDGSREAGGKRLHVVLPAGNSHRWRCHAMGLCRPEGGTQELAWKILPDDDGDNFVEIWIPCGAVLDVVVRPPDGGAAQKVRIGGLPLEVAFFRRDEQAKPYGMLLTTPRVPQSTKGTMALLALAGSALRTRVLEELELRAKAAPLDTKSIFKWLAEAAREDATEFKRGPAPHGIWRISLSAPKGAEALTWHAWVQRGDAAPLRAQRRRGFAGRQSYFVEFDESNPEPSFTLNGIATVSHDRLHVVGAMRRRDSTASPYSAAGPARDQPDRFCGPDWVVPADESLNRPGLLVRGVFSGARQRLSGTSAAAAVFSRYLYENLAAGRDVRNHAHLSPAHPSRRPPNVAGAPRDADLIFRGELNRVHTVDPAGKPEVAD